MSGQADDRPVFYYDLGSPYAWLTAERIGELFEVQPVWQPILLGGLFKRFGRSSWAGGPDRATHQAEVERRAAAYGLLPLRWPEPFPTNTLTAMRAATYAKEIGRVVAFSLAAFRQHFAGGRDLADPETSLLAAAACEIHPRAVTASIGRPAIKDALREATDRAADAGVRGVPSVVVRGEVFWGDDRLEEAARSAGAHG